MSLLKPTSIAVLLLAASQFVVSAQDLFKLQFAGSQRFLNSRGNLATHKLTDLDLISHCVGTNVPATNNSLMLAYNASADSIDVVSTNGSVVCELWRLVTVVTNSDRHRLDRFVYLMAPDETNAVGTGIISQKVKNLPDIYSISGRLQFFFGVDLGNSKTNSIVRTNTPVAAPPGTNAGTNTASTTNSTSTNGLAITPPTPTTTTTGSPALGGSAATNSLSGTVGTNAISGTVTTNALSGNLTPPVPGVVNPVMQTALLTTKGSLLSTNNVPGTNTSDSSTGGFSVEGLPLNVTNVHLWYGTFTGGRRIVSSGSITNTH